MTKKKLWKKCSYCGIITDLDEKHCPNPGLRNNLEHNLEIVELDEEEIRRLLQEKKIYTKHVREWLFK